MSMMSGLLLLVMVNSNGCRSLGSVTRRLFLDDADSRKASDLGNTVGLCESRGLSGGMLDSATLGLASSVLESQTFRVLNLVFATTNVSLFLEYINLSFHMREKDNGSV